MLTPGAEPPVWSLLAPWQEKVTRERFLDLLRNVVTDDKLWSRHIMVTEDAAAIRMATPVEADSGDGDQYLLRFAPPGSQDTAPALRYWRRKEELPPVADAARPLEGLHIALDPGHLGGVWADMEERHIHPAEPGVKEGELTLLTARVLAPLLEKLGARVSHVRTTTEPLTPLRPDSLMATARASLGDRAAEEDVRKEAERLFYRSAEVRARGVLVNQTLRPDLVLCLHFNGDGRGDLYSPANHLHILAHGCMGDGEFRNDDQRLEGLLRLVQRIPEVEIPLCVAVGRSMAAATGLPPFTYYGGNARAVPGEPYVWTRNLLANRVYQCPVVFLEPWVMNNREVFEQLRAGDYEGTVSIGGRARSSIFREYAEGVTAGLRDYFLDRPRA